MELNQSDLDQPDTWEHLCLWALNIAERDLPSLERLAAAYTALGDRHATQGAVTGRVGPRDQDDAATRLVRLLIFARRTYLVGRSLSRALPQISRAGTLLDRGSGFGPLLMALGSPGKHLLADELFPEYAPIRSRLLSAIGLPQAVRDDFEQTDRRGLVLETFGYSFAEYAGGDERRAISLVQDAVQGKGRDCLIIEPGDRRHGRLLQAVRDGLVQAGLHPHGPCRGALRCPYAEAPSDWCHFTERARPGPLAERIAAKAGRTSSQLHYSYLFYGQVAADSRPSSEVAKVLASFAEGKKKARVTLCQGERIIPLTALRRDRDAFSLLRSLRPNADVRLEPGIPVLGDGVRITRPAQLAVVDPKD